jgi:glycosyltransferase involved in cell wall biosynthesis
MYVHEQRGDDPEEFPRRFLPFMEQEKIFDAGPERGVDVVASISSEQIEAFSSVFGDFPRERIVLSHNGYNQQVFRPAPELYDDRARVLAGFSTQPPAGSDRSPEPVAPADGFDAVVAFVGKFADWKRLDALLTAAASYERDGRRVLTVVAGSGPLEQQVAMNDLAAELGLELTYFLGPRQQSELATLFACADVGVFPSYREPFGLVFLECMACGTPVIGADSGGPRDFVVDAVGTLVPETDDRRALADSLAAAVTTALDDGWKQAKGPEAARYARDGFSVVKQVSDLLAEVDRLTLTPA